MTRDENPYETDNLLQMYLWLNYPLVKTRSSASAALGPLLPSEPIEPILPHSSQHETMSHALHFPQRVAQLLISLTRKSIREETEKSKTSMNATADTSKGRNENNLRALDVGCAVGGSSLELATFFQFVEAFDTSERFIQAANEMKTNKKIEFYLPVEGDIHDAVTAVLPSYDNNDANIDLPPNEQQRINYFVGDACQLSQYDFLGTFDAILLSNLLCRLPDPMKCLNSLPELVNRGGIVLFVTPYSWLEQYTPRNKWLGGYYESKEAKDDNDDGKRGVIRNDTKLNAESKVMTKDVLKLVMEKNGFEKIHEENIPLILREHARKYQYIISEATGWRKE